MPDLAPPTGIRLRLPAGVRLVEPDEGGVDLRDLDFSGSIELAPRPTLDPLMEQALVDSELSPLWQFDLEDAPGAPVREFGDLDGPIDLAEPESATLDIEVGADEDVVVLVSDEDVLHWVLPEAPELADPSDPTRFRSTPGEPGLRRFRLRVTGEEAGDGTRGLFKKLGKKLKAVVLRFVVDRVAGWAIDKLVAKLEAKAVPVEGPVWISGGEWTARPDLRQIPTEGVQRVLLWIHGTFSSTEGSFGALRHGPAAHAFVGWVRNYDLVLGYDHRTLSVTPEDNAEALADLLEQLDGAVVDIVCYSRGGLVARWLCERVLPERTRRPEIQRVYFVGPANGGTELARSANWHALVDTMTNLALASSKVLVLLGAGGAAVPILAGVIKGVGVLVKALATVGTEGRIPGLWAMNPDEPFLGERTNGDALPPQPEPAPRYFAMTSDFEPKLLQASPEPERHQLPPKLLQLLADGFIDRLFGAADGERVANDLVVDSASARRVHPDVVGRFDDSFDGAVHLEDSAACYHLNYFVQDDLIGWLDGHLDPKQAGPVPLVDPGFRDADIPKNGGDSQAAERPEATVTLQVEAEAPAKVELGTPFDLVTRIARALERSGGTNVAFAELVGVDPNLPLILDVRAIRGVKLLDEESRFSRPVPGPDETDELTFLLEPTALGTGEVWVTVGQRPDVRRRLKLQVEVVEVLEGASEAVTATMSASAGNPPHGHLLECTLRREDGGFSLEYDLTSWPLQLRRRYPPHQVDGDLPAFVAALHADIEAKAKGRKADKGLLRELRAIGMRLCEQLFPEALRRDLWAHRDGLHGLQVLSDEPYIPWELIHLKDPDATRTTERRFLGELGLTRTVWNLWAPERIVLHDGGFEVLVPEYPAGTKYVLPFAVREGAWLQERYGARPVADRSLDGVLERLGAGRNLDVLHYAGHGDSGDRDVFLILEGKVDGTSWSPERLSATVAAAETDLGDEGEGGALVFLNACQTGQQHFELTEDVSWSRVLLEAGAGAVIAPVWVVGDDTALTFSRRLYEALLDQGLPFAEATRVAREAAFRDGDPTWLAYRVYANPQGRVVRDDR